jgi:hypothetical protein
MQLRYDPFQVFRHSKTPVGLYARQKWLEEAESARWQTDFAETVRMLSADQSADGSWYHDAVTTIHRLFGLHLTIRSSNRCIANALNWLIKYIRFQSDGIRVDLKPDINRAQLEGLPFVPSCPVSFITGSTLFLATIFGQQNDPAVLALYQWLCADGRLHGQSWQDRASLHNIFRAMVVHPVFSRDDATASAVNRLSDLQTESGHWGDDLSFYQTLNALAHLDMPQADIQVEKAFTRLFEIQNTDGTWSQREPEWNTFLAIHALKNKGCI